MSDDNRFSNTGVLRQHRFDLAGLDPIAAYLDLIVEAAQILDVAVRPNSAPGLRSYTTWPEDR